MPRRRLGLAEDVGDIAANVSKEIATLVSAPYKLAKHGIVDGSKMAFNDLVESRDNSIRSSNKLLKNLGFKHQDKLQSEDIKDIVAKLKQLTSKPSEKAIKFSPSMTKQKMKSPVVSNGYSVGVPSAVSKVMRHKPIKISGKPNCITVTHREYFSDVVASVSGFGLAYGSSYIIDPAEPAAFPWLAPIACQFQKFKLTKLKVEYISDCSSVTDGSVLISFNRNAATPIPANKQQFLEAAECIRTPAWQSATMSVKCDDTKYWTQPYAYPPPVIANQFIGGGVAAQNNTQTTQAGILYVATSGVTSSVSLGELYFDFTFELSEPIAILPPVVLCGLQVSAGSSATNPWPNPALIGSDIAVFGTLPIAIGGTAGYNFLYPGDYMLTVVAQTTASDTLALTVSGTQVATLIGQATNTTGLVACWLITGGVLGNNEYVTITGLAHLTTSTSHPFKMYFTNYSAGVAGLPTQ